MRRSTTLVLAVLAVAAATGAIATAIAQRPTTELARGERLFPGLADRLARSARIEVAKGDTRFSLTHAADGWHMPEKGGYLADFETVRQALVGISELEIVEPKTAKPELLGRLDLSDDKALALTVKDEGGQPLVAILVGKRRAGSGADADQPMTYVRRAGEAQAWLVQGGLDIKPAPVDWLSKTVVDVKADTVASVEIVPGEIVPADGKPDEQPVKLVAGDDGKLKPETVPEGMKVKSDYDIESVGSALEALAFEDVRKAEGLGTPLGTTIYHLKDGGTITATVAEADGARWLTLSGGPAAKAEGWAFKLPDWKRRLFQLRREDLFEAEKKDQPAGG